MFNLFRSRDKAVRILLTGLLVVVGLSMVTYLIPSTGLDPTSAPDSTVLATIGKEQLTSQQVSKVVQTMTQSRQLPQELLAIYVPQIVQQMISERALAYEAGRLGMTVSQDETENAIMDSLPPQLIKDGKVDAANLAALLQQQGVTMADLKSDTARQVLVSRLRQIVSQGVVVTPREIADDFHRKSDKTRIEYALLTPAKYQAEAEPTEAEMKAYYDARKPSFQTPEKRSLGVIVLDPSRVNVILPTDAQMQKDYNSSLERFRTPERVDARHILIKSDASNDAAMKAKAEGLLKQIQAGGDFAKLAKENSQDNAAGGSAEKGGELGWLVRGQTVPEFEKAAFALQPGETSGLVKTTYGYHIIQVEKHEQAHLQPFEEVKGQLTADYMQRASTGELQKTADKAAAELRKDPLHPDKAAAAAGASLIRAENLQAGDPIPGVGPAKELTDAIAALHKGEIAGPVVLPGNKIVLASVLDYQPARQASFEEAKADVRNRATQEKLQKIVADKAKELLAKTQAMGGDLEKVAKEMGLEVKTSTDVDRQGAFEGVGSASTVPDAFTKPDGAVFGPVTVTGGEMVAKVIAKTPANMADLPAQAEAIRSELKQKKITDRTTLFEEGLKNRLTAEGKLKVHQDVLARLVSNYTNRS
jgi:peptidyl-prolyl cis-trans isomerase D